MTETFRDLEANSKKEEQTTKKKMEKELVDEYKMDIYIILKKKISKEKIVRQNNTTQTKSKKRNNIKIMKLQTKILKDKTLHKPKARRRTKKITETYNEKKKKEWFV